MLGSMHDKVKIGFANITQQSDYKRELHAPCPTNFSRKLSYTCQHTYPAGVDAWSTGTIALLSRPIKSPSKSGTGAAGIGEAGAGAGCFAPADGTLLELVGGEAALSAGWAGDSEFPVSLPSG